MQPFETVTCLEKKLYFLYSYYMNPSEVKSKPNMFKNIVKRTGGALGIQVAPSMEQSTVVPEPGLSSAPAKSIDFNAIKPQADLVQPLVLPATENTSQNAPLSTAVPAEHIVPIEQPVQPHIAEFTPSPAASVSGPEAPLAAVPDQKDETVEPPPEVVESVPAEPAVAPLSADVSQPEASIEVPEDPVATELISHSPELFIKEGVLDFEALKAAKEAKLIAENPKAQNLINQLHEAGVVNSEVVSKLVQPILSEIQKAA